MNGSSTSLAHRDPRTDAGLGWLHRTPGKQWLLHMLGSATILFAAAWSLPCQQSKSANAARPSTTKQQTAVDAPLLAFYSNGPDGKEQTYVVDALADTVAVSIGIGRIDVLGRFADGRLLCRTGWPKACMVTMAPDGSDRRILVPGDHDSVQPDFIDMQHGRVYVRFRRFDEQLGSLRVFEPGGPELGTELLDRVDQVLSRSIDGLCVLRAPDGAAIRSDRQPARGGELWFVPRQRGGARRVLAELLDFGKQGLSPRIVAAPSGRLLAIGCNRLDGTGGHLCVVDVVAGKVVVTIDGINLEVSPFSSNLPAVELAWRDDRVLRYSRTNAAKDFEWVDHDVRDNEEVAAEVYSGMSLSHQEPRGHREDELQACARVRFDARGVWFLNPAGDGDKDNQNSDEPVVPAPASGFSRGFAGTLQISPRGRAAACLVGDRVLIVDGVHREVRVVFDGRWQFPKWAALPTGG